MQEVKEITILNLNIRGLNSAAKQLAIDKVVNEVHPHVICLNETKLQYELYLDNFWYHQTMHQRHGGCWTAASTNTRLNLVKALGTYLCWTRLTTGSKQVQILNCYLQPGEEEHLKQRATRVTDIVRDILRQDAKASVVVCGDFNNHMHHITSELTKCGFKSALDPNIATHTHGGSLDQLFAKNIDITNALVNEGFDKEITDHKCLKVTLGF